MTTKVTTTAPHILLAAALLCGALEGNLLYDYAYRSENLHHVDLPSFWAASRLAFVEHRSPYDYERMTAYSKEVGRHVFPFLYPPVSLLSLYPLHGLDWPAAARIVLALNHLLAVACVGLLLALLLRRNDEPAVVVIALFLAACLVTGMPAVNTIVHGQLNLLVLFLLCLSWLGLRRGCPVAAGLALASAILVKPTPVVFLLYLAARRSWRALASTAAVLAIAGVVSLAILPADLWWTWLFDVRPSLGYGVQPVHLFSPACASNQSLNAVAARLFLGPDCRPIDVPVPLGGRWVVYAAALGILGSSVLAVARAHERARPGRDATDFGFCLFLAAMFLVGSLSWEHHLVFALPGLALVFLTFVRRPRGGLELPGLAFASLGTLVTLPLSHPALHQGWAVGLISVRALAVAILWWLLRRRMDCFR